ncbi:hypothetical protein TNIN_165681 [Trichonephila inaurata madagascariensis]|uniref:Uncharacterized protein n=1 Tax=Trichonephila inaurata madagascariensis TaxID=2747483 RepID=A0A8X6WUM7_9ARAC|nr:hypothetical protein TNIN_165681 [Trichonephila inaurata madagascariensis]
MPNWERRRAGQMDGLQHSAAQFSLYLQCGHLFQDGRPLNPVPSYDRLHFLIMKAVGADLELKYCQYLRCIITIDR